MRDSPTVLRILGKGKQQEQPTEWLGFPSDCYAFADLFSLARTALRSCCLSKALSVRSVTSGKKCCRRAGASWALLSRAPCSHPEFTLPGRNKQTQPQPCSSVRGLGLYSMHTTISRCRQRLAFCSGA